MSRLLAAGWAPTVVKRHTARAWPAASLRRMYRYLTGQQPGLAARAAQLQRQRYGAGVALGPAPMPRGLAVGAVTVAGRLYLCVRYRLALLDPALQMISPLLTAALGRTGRPAAGGADVIAHAGIMIALAATVIYNFGFILEKRALAYLPAIDAQRIWWLVRTLFTAPAGWQGSC